MILGFTGTRAGLTKAQLAALPSVIAVLPATFIHGGAVGADESVDAFMQNGDIEVYPCSFDRWTYWHKKLSRLVHPVRPALERNRIIVARCHSLLACPGTAEEERRSGTWATIRYARAARKPVMLILPDGSVREE